MALSIHGLIDDEKCYAMVRSLRWPYGVDCPHCQSKHFAKNGHDTTEVFRQPTFAAVAVDGLTT